MACARRPGGSGDTRFEVLDFRTSGHFWFSTTVLIAFTYSCRSVSDCKFRWFKAFKRESSNLLLNRKSQEVLKSKSSNPMPPEPPGPRAQAPRRLWGRQWGKSLRDLLISSWLSLWKGYPKENNKKRALSKCLEISDLKSNASTYFNSYFISNLVRSMRIVT